MYMVYIYIYIYIQINMDGWIYIYIHTPDIHQIGQKLNAPPLYGGYV